MSIVRQGLAEDKKYADGYEAIFGKKSSGGAKAGKKPIAKATAARKKPAKKKK